MELYPYGMQHRHSFLSQAAVWAVGLFIVASLGVKAATHASIGFVMEGTEGWGKRPMRTITPASPRLNVLEVDVWRHSLEDGSLKPIAKLPFSRRELVRSDQFSPRLYQRYLERLGHTYARQQDVLMYYGGVPSTPRFHGLNFNAWSVEDLRKLRLSGSRPFIGLETTDPRAVEWMMGRLHDAGYGRQDRIYTRICSEPAGTWYGSEDGTRRGRRHTPAAHAAYKRRFASVSGRFAELNARYGLSIQTVFAGTSGADFKYYMPSSDVFQAIGFDLYVTPENKDQMIRQIQDLARRLPSKPLVLPEFGMATAGPGASPRWAQDTLGEILMLLGKHPGGVAGVTVFSVNVAGRLPAKRWSWAWTPVMFEMLKEWEASPRVWHKDGFHLYDPMTYPVGRDFLYLNRPDVRLVYRKLATFKAPGVPWFHETRLLFKQNKWVPYSRDVVFDSTETLSSRSPS